MDVKKKHKRTLRTKKQKDKIRAAVNKDTVVIKPKDAKPQDPSPHLPAGNGEVRAGKVSKRVWKKSTIPKSSTKRKTVNMSYAQRRRREEKQRNVRDLQKKLNEMNEAEKQENRRKSEQRRKRKLENEKKGDVVQVIKDPTKIKRMKKSQLRQIRTQ